MRTVHAGRPDEHVAPFITGNVWPTQYPQVGEFDQMLGLTDKDPQILAAILLCLAGAALLVVLDRDTPPDETTDEVRAH